MLAFPRSTRAACRLSLHARTITTATHSAGSPTANHVTTAAEPTSSSGAASDETKTAMPQRRTRRGRAKGSVECMFVYPWDGIRSSAEGLAIARAVQDKYGPAKEVIFPRDSDCVNIFQPYLWLVFDNPDVRERHPEESAQISIQVAEMPRGDGNVGLEDMMRGLGLSTNEDKDASRESSPVTTETEASKDTSDAPPSGYKNIDVRVEWARSGPSEVLRRRRPVSQSFPNERLLPRFSAAWLAFDGFSPESARGPHTPNLLHARKKWQKIASSLPPPSGGDEDVVAAGSLSQEFVDADIEPELTSEPAASETQTQQTHAPPAREWVPIVPRDAERLASTSAPTFTPSPKATPASTTSASTPLDPALTPDAADTTNDDDIRAHMPPKAEAASSITKMSRRERILHLARQNARTPLPEPVEEPKPPTDEAEKEKVGDEESERHVKERTIRERLWRLVGGNY